MEQQATDFFAATRTALNQASALLVQYSFSIVGAIVLLILGWLFAGFISRWAFAGISRIHGIDETLARFFTNVLYYSLLMLVFITVLGQFGVQTASIIAALGAAGLAVGLALQGTLQNIAAGIMLLVLRPFRVGEFIETSTVSGTVKEIGLFATELRTTDGLYRLAPNSVLWNTPITNYTREPVRRHSITVTIASTNDVDAVINDLLKLVKADPNVETHPAPQAFIDTLGASMAVTINYWIKRDAYLSTSRKMVRATKLAFDEKEISFV